MKGTLIFILIGFTFAGVAQTKKKSILREQEIAKIDSFFKENTPWEKVPDTSQIYSFAFKVEVVRKAKNKTVITSIETNSPIAYTLYPNYHFLKEINYSLFMDQKQRCTFIYPIVLDVWNENWPEKPAPRYDEVVAAAFYSSLGVKDLNDRVYFKPHMLRLDLGMRN
ncbi:MAG: hypothetical protein RI924_1526 [Bacteroidota bacterium]|jgi:hypothetical protein